MLGPMLATQDVGTTPTVALVMGSFKLLIYLVHDLEGPRLVGKGSVIYGSLTGKMY
jgi:hypothetical protein